MKVKNGYQKTLISRQIAEKKRPASVPLLEGPILKGVYVYIYLTCVYGMFLLGSLLSTPFSFLLHLIVQAVMLLVFTLYIFLIHYVDSDRVRYCRLRNLNVGHEAWVYAKEYLKVIIFPMLLLFVLIPLNHIDRLAPEALSSMRIGLFAMLTLFAVSCFTDTFAYIVGSWLKGPKLVPNISPKKTVSGAVGGLFGGMIGALLILLCFTGQQAFLDLLTDKIGNVWAVRFVFIGIGLVGSVLTQIGDIFASALKRKKEVKDFGSLLPGHGGIMDRLDGISFNALFIFICTLILVFVL